MSLRGTWFNLICGIIYGMELSEKKIKVPTTGVYDFERLILDSRGKYVDKTRLLYELASDADQQLFISRPRRFGKSLMLSTLKDVLKTNIVTQMSTLTMTQKIKEMKHKFDASEHGGAPLLGISKPVIKAHGSSDAKAVKNAIKQAIYYVNTGIIIEIARQSSQLTKKESAKTGTEE